MGGRIGFAMAQYAPGWVHSLILGDAAANGRSRIDDGIRAADQTGALDAIRIDSLGFSDVLPSMTMPELTVRWLRRSRIPADRGDRRGNAERHFRHLALALGISAVHVDL